MEITEKKFLSKNALIFFVVLIVILLSAVGVLAVQQYRLFSKNNQLLADNYSLKKDISAAQTTITQLQAASKQNLSTNVPWSEMRSVISTLPSQSDVAMNSYFANNYVAIVTPEGKKYHAPWCPHLANASTVSIYSVDGALNLGYEQCSDCASISYQDFMSRYK